MKHLIEQLEKSKTLLDIANKYTLIIDENQVTHGALFFIPVGSKTFKVMVPSPFHVALLAEESPSYKRVLNHPQAILLK